MTQKFTRPELLLTREGTGSPSEGLREFVRATNIIVSFDDTADFNPNDYVTEELAINAAIGSLTAGRDWVETVKLMGDFNISGTILLDPYTELDLTEARITLTTDANCHMITNNGVMAAGDVAIIGGFLDGNSGNQGGAGPYYGIYIDFNQKYVLRIYDTHIMDMKGYGIVTTQIGQIHAEAVRITDCLGGMYLSCYDGWFIDCAIASITGVGVYLLQSCTDNIWEGCYFGGATIGNVLLHGCQRQLFADCINQDAATYGYKFEDSDGVYARYNSIVGGLCNDNSASENNADIILAGSSHHNYIDDVIFEEHTADDKATFAIEEQDTAYSNIIGRNIYAGQVTAPVNLISPTTKIPTYPYNPFYSAQLQTSSPIGIVVNGGGEQALFVGGIPEDVFQVVRLRIKGVALGAPIGAGGQMHSLNYFNAGAMNEVYNTANKSWSLSDFDSEEADYIANDGISWLIWDSDVGNELRNLVAGDTFEYIFQYRVGADPDGATNVAIRSLELECV